jgi:hypothetical protein
MKKVLIQVLAGLLITPYAFSQFSVMLNEQPVKQNDEYQLKDVKTLNVSFKNAAKIPEYTSGRAAVYINLETSSGKFLNQWVYEVDGYKAANNFLYPKTPVVYSAWSNTTTTTDMVQKYTYDDVFYILQKKYGNIDYRKFKVTVNLTFEESISWDKYGKAQVLIEPLTFYLDFWSKTNIIDLEAVQAKYNYSESSTYKSFTLKNEADNGITGLADAKHYEIIFDEFYATLQVLSIDGSQDDALNSLKTHFEGYLNYNANVCNGKKILKNIPVPDNSRDWNKLTRLGTSEVFVELDQKNNPNYASVKIWSPVSLGATAGYKFKGMRYSNDCTTTSVLVATVEGPADPAKRSLEGSNLMYIVKHPGNGKKLLIFTFATTSGSIKDVNGLSVHETQMEQFLSALTQ